MKEGMYNFMVVIPRDRRSNDKHFYFLLHMWIFLFMALILFEYYLYKLLYMCNDYHLYTTVVTEVLKNICDPKELNNIILICI